MNTFSIRDIENLCGIRAHTLRIWEQRYQFLRPKRKAGNHRLYDSEDLKYLLRISFLYHHGHKPSVLARLNDAALIQLIDKQPPSPASHEIFINKLFEASLDYDQIAFEQTLSDVILHMGFEKAIGRVVFPFLIRIGRLWLSGHVVPAQEHFVSAIIMRRLFVAIDDLDSLPPGPRAKDAIVLFTPSDEFHELPLLFMRYLMKKNGLPVIYFGHNTSLGELQHYCAARPVSTLYFHLVTNLLHCKPEQYVRKLLEAFPGKTIVLSGSLGESLKDRFPRLRILATTAEMEAFARGD